MCVNRCVCFDVSFVRLKDHIEKHGGGLDEIQRTFLCGKGCGMCIPYIRRMIQTGETSMPVMLTEAADASGDNVQHDEGESNVS